MRGPPMCFLLFRLSVREKINLSKRGASVGNARKPRACRKAYASRPLIQARTENSRKRTASSRTGNRLTSRFVDLFEWDMGHEFRVPK